MNFFPLSLKLDKVLVIGGGMVAQRKIIQLLDNGIGITVISPKLTARLNKLAVSGAVEWKMRSFAPGDTAGYSLVIAAVDNESVNETVFREASAAGIPVNVVDKPELCTVIFPAVIRRGDLTIAVSSNGKAPFFVKALKKGLEKSIPKAMEIEIKIAGEFRDWLKKNCSDDEIKQKMYEHFLFAIGFYRNQRRFEYPGVDEWKDWLKEYNNAGK